MEGAAHDRLIDIHITVPDFQVEAAIRIGADPGFIADGRPLAAEIGQRHEVSGVALLALGETDWFHESSSQPMEIRRTSLVYPKPVEADKRRETGIIRYRFPPYQNDGRKAGGQGVRSVFFSASAFSSSGLAG
jgi:hypothetical protein